MMQNPITYRRFMDMSPLWIIYIKITIGAMHVGFVFQITMQLKNMLFKVFLKQHDIFFMTFPTSKFVPCQKQVLWVDNYGK